VRAVAAQAAAPAPLPGLPAAAAAVGGGQGGAAGEAGELDLGEAHDAAGCAAGGGHADGAGVRAWGGGVGVVGCRGKWDEALGDAVSRKALPLLHRRTAEDASNQSQPKELPATHLTHLTTNQPLHPPPPPTNTRPTTSPDPRTRQQLLGVLQHRLKDAQQRLRQVVVQVVLAVYGEVVLQRVYGVLSLWGGGGVGGGGVGCWVLEMVLVLWLFLVVVGACLLGGVAVHPKP